MAEELLTRFFSEKRVEQELQRQILGLTSGQARRLINQVRDSWLAASIEDPDVRRARLRAAGEAVYSAAMNRTEQAKDAKGNPIVDTDASGKRSPRLISAPDLRQANASLRFLAALDGISKSVDLDGTLVLNGLTSAIDLARTVVVDGTVVAGELPEEGGKE